MKCEYCMNLKHRYMLLTGMHYPRIQKALDGHKINASDFSCEGMGCKFFSQGSEIGPDMRDKDWNCPHFEKLKDGRKYRGIDSHANRNEYPEIIHLTEKNGKITILDPEKDKEVKEAIVREKKKRVETSK